MAKLKHPKGPIPFRFKVTAVPARAMAALLKCTTRHVRLFARVENEDLVPSGEELTLDLDPDNEFLWSDAVVTKVQQRFQGGGSRSRWRTSDYNLRRIGTDLEGYIRQLLQSENSATTRWTGAELPMGLPRRSAVSRSRYERPKRYDRPDRYDRAVRRGIGYERSPKPPQGNNGQGVFNSTLYGSRPGRVLIVGIGIGGTVPAPPGRPGRHRQFSAAGHGRAGSVLPSVGGQCVRDGHRDVQPSPFNSFVSNPRFSRV